jgi:glyoxylase-like metal-dependent hydrolase (beta-lactamase superfamily II)
MKLERLNRFLYVLENTCNTYLIRRSDKALVIDCGDGSILDYIDSIGVTKVEKTFITHHHRDQCQGSWKLVEHGSEIYAPEYEVELLRNAEHYWLNRQIFDNYNCRSTAYSLTRDVKAVRPLQDYSTIEWRDFSLAVIPTPGHTLGSVSIVVVIEEYKYIFTGDLLREEGKLHTLYDLQLSYGGWEGVDQLHHSIRSIARQEPAVICPSHGQMVTKPAVTLRKLVTNVSDWYEWCKQGNLLVLDKQYYPYGAPQFPSDFSPCQITKHVIAFPNACSTFYVIMTDTGEALFIDFGGAGWSHFWSHMAFREPWETQRFVEHSIHELEDNYQLRRIEVVIPTHYHDDHIHGIPYLIQHYGTEVWCLDKIAEVIQNPNRHNLMCLFNKPISVDRVLSHGESFDWRGFGFSVWHFPGQTEYHQLCLVKTDDKKILFTGDSLFPAGDRGEILSCPVIFRNYHRHCSHIECADLLASLSPDIVAPGHGPVFSPSSAQIEAFKQRSIELDRLYHRLLPESEKWAGIDPYWIQITPYQIITRPGDGFRASLKVRNYSSEMASAIVELCLPPNWYSTPENQHICIPANAESTSFFDVLVPADFNGLPRLAISADVTLNGKRIGQFAEAVVTIRDQS